MNNKPPHLKPRRPLVTSRADHYDLVAVFAVVIYVTVLFFACWGLASIVRLFWSAR